MDRRESIRSLVLASFGSGLVLSACVPEKPNEITEPIAQKNDIGRTPSEREKVEALQQETFFAPEELTTLTQLANLIIPPNGFGDIRRAEVPEFIEFMAKDIPELQLPLRGGIMWLQLETNNRFGKGFNEIEEGQQKEILDDIAFYDPSVPKDSLPFEIKFFNLMRNLTVTGYYSSKVGVADLGYKGNQPNVWDGVPEKVLEQHGISYEESWLQKCVDQSKRNIKAVWDNQGNLIT